MNRWLEEESPTEFGRLLQRAMTIYRPKLHSANAVGKLVGISPTLIINYLRGDSLPNQRTARRIADALGIDWEEMRAILPDPMAPPAPRVVDKDQFAKEVAEIVVQRLNSEATAPRGNLTPDDPLIQEKNLLFDAISGVASPEGLEAVRRVLEDFRAKERADAVDR